MSDTVRVSHILVKEEPACLALAAQLEEDETIFATLAQEQSLCPSGQRGGGDLGVFSRGKMVSAFEDVAFDLEIGETSGCFLTDFGYHIVRRTG